MKLDALAGYVERGLSDDLGKWYAKARRCKVDKDDIRPLATFLEHLAPKHHRTMKAFDKLVRGGKWPSVPGLDIMDNWTYGFDFAKNEVEVLDESGDEVDREAIYSLACDGGGNHYMVVADGRVVVWNHEEGSIEEHTQFANLDVFLWVMVRLGAIKSKKLARAEVEKEIRSLKQPGADFLLDHG